MNQRNYRNVLFISVSQRINKDHRPHKTFGEQENAHRLGTLFNRKRQVDVFVQRPSERFPGISCVREHGCKIGRAGCDVVHGDGNYRNLFALGPIFATAVLAFSSLNWLYIFIGNMSLLAVVSYAFCFAGASNIEKRSDQYDDQIQR